MKGVLQEGVSGGELERGRGVVEEEVVAVETLGPWVYPRSYFPVT